MSTGIGSWPAGGPSKPEMEIHKKKVVGKTTLSISDLGGSL